MKINKIINFLRSQEKKLSGHDAAVPIDLTLWANKGDLVSKTLLEFTKYYYAIENLKAKSAESFSDHLLKMQLEADSNSASCLESTFSARSNVKGKVDKNFSKNLARLKLSESFLDWQLEEDVHIEILKIMIHNNYELPEENGIVNFTGIQIHLFVYFMYLRYMATQKTFFPFVNEKINYAGLVLIQACDMFIAAISSKGKSKDTSTPGVKAKQKEADAKKKAIESILKKNGINNFQIFRKNKKLRKTFLEACRTATAAIDEKNHIALSDERIFEIGNEIFKNTND